MSGHLDWKAYQDDCPDPPGWRKLEWLQSGIMKYEESGKKSNDIEKSYHTEKQEHVHSCFVTDPFLHKRSVKSWGLQHQQRVMRNTEEPLKQP